MTLTCDQCDTSFAAPAGAKGQKVHCPKCRAFVRVPAAPPAVRVYDPATRAIWRLIVVLGCVALAAAVVFKVIEEIDLLKRGAP